MTLTFCSVKRHFPICYAIAICFLYSSIATVKYFFGWNFKECKGFNHATTCIISRLTSAIIFFNVSDVHAHKKENTYIQMFQGWREVYCEMPLSHFSEIRTLRIDSSFLSIGKLKWYVFCKEYLRYFVDRGRFRFCCRKRQKWKNETANDGSHRLT